MCLSQVTVSVQGLLDNVQNDNSFCCSPSDVRRAVDKLAMVHSGSIQGLTCGVPPLSGDIAPLTWHGCSENQPKNGVG